MEQDNSDWVRRNVVDEPRLSELAEMYESLGFEVEMRNFLPEESPDDCTQCMIEHPEQHKIIFTRRKEK